MNNANHGVFARNASILIGDTSGSFNTFSGVNTISGNGTAVPSSAGVFGFVGTAMVVRNATITGNNGFGLFLSVRSSAEISGNTITGTNPGTGNPLSAGGGIRLALGSALFIDNSPANTITANNGFGLNCTDGESSVSPAPAQLAFPGNTLGGATGISAACTGF